MSPFWCVHSYYLKPQVFGPAGSFLLENKASPDTNSEEMSTSVPLPPVSALHQEIPPSYRDMIQDNVRRHLIVQVIAASV